FNPIRIKLQAILSNRNNLIYLSGHDQNLQIIPENTNYFINSGSPTQATYSAKDNNALFAKAMPGIIELQYYQTGKIDAQILSFSEEKGFQSHSIYPLFLSANTTQSTPLPINYSLASLDAKNIGVKPESNKSRQTGIVSVKAGPEYNASNLKTFFLGKHYRPTWTTPIQVPYLDLDTTFNGLTVNKKGGGRQTKSLTFKNPVDEEYVFRSVNKDPSKALNYELRETIIARVLRDQTTTQHPYGAMAADVMLNELDILHAHPKLYVLPDDPKIGPFRSEFANLLGMLEERPSVPKKQETGFAGAQEIVKSNKLFRELYNNPRVKVDKEQFARARVFDILVGDWGKHEDNWKWAGYKQENGMLYKPIPRDRDHVFSRWDGFIPWLADREWAKPSGENFDYTIKDIRSLTWQARHLDRLVANELIKNDWLNAAKTVQTRINEEIIENAVASMPAEIQTISGQEVSQKLKTRIKDLDTYTLNYYKLLAKYVDVVGSNQEEYFEVNRLKGGSVEVFVYGKNQLDKPDKSNSPYYHRIFYPPETKEIRLYGLKGQDIFDIKGESKKSIKIRVIGGPGSDVIEEKSKVAAVGKKTFIYEQNPKSQVTPGEEGKIIKTWNQSVYNYDRTAFAYNTYFPSPYISYNQYNGIEFGFGMLFTQQKFGKQDYSTKHQIQVSGTTRGNLVFNYSSRLHHVFRKWDVAFEGIYARPDNYNFFFGFGNETIKDKALFNKDYYLARYNLYGVGTSLIHDFWKRSNFSLTTSYQRYKGITEPNTFLNEQKKLYGIAPLHMLEGEVKLDLDFRDNPYLPNKGMRFFITHQNGFITNYNNQNYGITNAFVEHYSSMGNRFPVTLGLKAGGGDTYGNLPFYRQLSLGQLNDLRGYVRYRFTGDSKLYVNSELRVQLLDTKTEIVPIKLGIKGFYDWGRVYLDNENSNKWHQGYGGGIYIVPLNERFTCSASVAFSEEESGFVLISLGRAFR
ncbi:MAG: outer membrane protein assembly factor, partial [Bacteroidota bacterium]|nr:outer membrane protein assembly factor [Bacteroidota bacterium]